MYVPTHDNRWISEEFTRLSEIIKDYDSSLELRWIPPENRKTENERKKPMVIWDLSSNTPVRYLSERDDPVEVLAALWDSDNKRGSVLERLEARERAQRAFDLKKELEEGEELRDQAAFLMGTRKNYIKHNGKRFDDQLRRLE